VALTRAPEDVGGNHDISFEAPFTLSLTGHIDIDVIILVFLFAVSGLCLLFGECYFLPSHSLACGNIVS